MATSIDEKVKAEEPPAETEKPDGKSKLDTHDMVTEALRAEEDPKPAAGPNDVPKEGDAETEDTDESETSGDASPDGAEVAGGSDAPPAPRTFTEGTDEFTAEIARQAQSQKDKELAPLQEETKTLKAKVAELEAAATHRSEDSGLDRLEAAETDQHGDTPEVQDIQATRRQVITMGRENEVEKARLDTLALTLVDVERDHQAWQKVLPLLLPDDATQIAKVNDLVEKLKAATNEAHMDSIWEGIERDLRDMKTAETESKRTARKPRKPDGSAASVSAARKDTSKMSADELVTMAVEKEEKEANAKR